jgi:hypothetical protein
VRWRPDLRLRPSSPPPHTRNSGQSEVLPTGDPSEVAVVGVRRGEQNSESASVPVCERASEEQGGDRKGGRSTGDGRFGTVGLECVLKIDPQPEIAQIHVAFIRTPRLCTYTVYDILERSRARRKKDDLHKLTHRARLREFGGGDIAR